MDSNKTGKQGTGHLPPEERARIRKERAERRQLADDMKKEAPAEHGHGPKLKK